MRSCNITIVDRERLRWCYPWHVILLFPHKRGRSGIYREAGCSGEILPFMARIVRLHNSDSLLASPRAAVQTLLWLEPRCRSSLSASSVYAIRFRFDPDWNGVPARKLRQAFYSGRRVSSSVQARCWISIEFGNDRDNRRHRCEDTTTMEWQCRTIADVSVANFLKAYSYS